MLVALILCLFVAPSKVLSQSLVIIGGGLSDSNADVIDRFLDLAGGAANARIGIVTASSADPVDSAIYYKDLFENQYGALETYWIPVHVNNIPANSDPDVVANTNRMTGFFFGGGDQARIIQSFYNDGHASHVLQAIQAVYTGGAVVGGSSAGAAAMPEPIMIMGGMSYQALRYGAFRDGEQGGNDDLIYEPQGGIGLFNDYIIDSHTGERGREGRLARLVWDSRAEIKSAKYGIGPDENTAFVITDANSPNAEGEVFGRWGVIVLDLTEAVDTSSEHFGLDNIKAHYLTHGDKITMVGHLVTFDTSWKTDLAGNEMYDHALTSSNIFDGIRSGQTTAEFARITRSLFDARLDASTRGVTQENNPKFALSFTQVDESRGYGGYSVVTGRWEISYTNLKLDISLCPNPCNVFHQSPPEDIRSRSGMNRENEYC